ncbi:MAG: endonuclease III [Bradymonadales bacterium]|nr:MAG: endonuclease III [Bradymonadales bacterium]
MKPEFKSRLLKVLRRLEAQYPDAHCALRHRNAFELMVATILSAQCTDERVNKTTPLLFERLPDPQAMASATLSEIEGLIHSCGFYRQKAKSLRETSRELVEKFEGQVPDRIEDLTQLRGIGRKTANVILGEIYGRPAGIVVDTHVKRLSRLLGFTRQREPEKIEADLNSKVPIGKWRLYSHWLITHGRQVCKARQPQCQDCFLLDLCPRNGLKGRLKPARPKIGPPSTKLVAKRNRAERAKNSRLSRLASKSK